MLTGHVNQALEQVRELRRVAMEGRRFRGYSGRARALSGTFALVTAGILGSRWYPHNVISHCDGWGTLVLVSVILNYGAVLRWFFMDSESRRDARRLLPIFDVLPPLLVGCALTIIFVIREDFQYLPGVWMCCYGLVNMSQHTILPESIRALGWYYIVCGVACMMVFNFPFLNPWPMGVVFFIGEWWGGFIFHVNRRENSNIFDFLAPSGGRG